MFPVNMTDQTQQVSFNGLIILSIFFRYVFLKQKFLCLLKTAHASACSINRQLLQRAISDSVKKNRMQKRVKE